MAATTQIAISPASRPSLTRATWTMSGSCSTNLTEPDPLPLHLPRRRETDLLPILDAPDPIHPHLSRRPTVMTRMMTLMRISPMFHLITGERTGPRFVESGLKNGGTSEYCTCSLTLHSANFVSRYCQVKAAEHDALPKWSNAEKALRQSTPNDVHQFLNYCMKLRRGEGGRLLKGIKKGSSLHADWKSFRGYYRRITRASNSKEESEEVNRVSEVSSTSGNLTQRNERKRVFTFRT